MFFTHIYLTAQVFTQQIYDTTLWKPLQFLILIQGRPENRFIFNINYIILSTTKLIFLFTSTILSIILFNLFCDQVYLRKMLDFFTIFSKGGILLWCFKGADLLPKDWDAFTPAVNKFIKTVLLQVKYNQILNYCNQSKISHRTEK